MDESLLFPVIEPYQNGWLKVDDIHELHWEQSGNPNGIPLVLLHGGPGSGFRPWHRQLFDPTYYRIILFDQRGAGKSRPLGETRNNTPEHLVSDMEALRAHLGIEKWIVSGASWGSTLALLYGEAHPERCTALVVRGIFTMRRSEINWLYNDIQTIFPEAMARFLAFLPEGERKNPVAAYLTRLMSDDPAIHTPAVAEWNALEDACLTLLPRTMATAPVTEEETARSLGRARIEAFYFVHHLFTPDDLILQKAHLLADVPGIIIEGRYDMICPYKTAWELAKAWPKAHFITVPDGGHSIADTSIQKAFMQAMADLQKSC